MHVSKKFVPEGLFLWALESNEIKETTLMSWIETMYQRYYLHAVIHEYKFRKSNYTQEI